jgi:hypothetical protein
MLTKYCINLAIISMLFVGFANILNNIKTLKSETYEITQTEEISSGETIEWPNTFDDFQLLFIEKNTTKDRFAEKPFLIFMFLYDIETPPPVNV